LCMIIYASTLNILIAFFNTIAYFYFFFQAEDGIRDRNVTGVQTCALPILATTLAEDPNTPPERVDQLRQEAEYFSARAQEYVNMFNPEAGTFTARNADGSWPVGADFDKKDWGGAFTEASAWTFAFHAPHDVDGLAALYGGRQGLVDELHEFLSTPEQAAYS